jgi:carbonic anhydrase
LERDLGTYKIDTTPPEALVVYCSDPRFQTAFRRFVTEELGIKNYAPLTIGGSIHAFGARTILPDNFKVLWKQIEFFVKVMGVGQVIVFNHEDCRWYQEMAAFYSGIKLPVKGKVDLSDTARALRSDFAGIEVRSFWAGLDGDRITFSEVK